MHRVAILCNFGGREFPHFLCVSGSTWQTLVMSAREMNAYNEEEPVQ